MALVWLGLGICCGILITTMRVQDILQENKRLRASIARTRTAITLGNLRTAARECELALEEEVAA